MLYRSKLEKDLAPLLNKYAAYEASKISYILECTYTPDWIDHERKIIFEAEGLFDAADRRKMKVIAVTYPDYQIVLVFQNPKQKIAKRSKTTYEQWATKNGFAVASPATLSSVLRPIYGGIRNPKS